MSLLNILLAIGLIGVGLFYPLQNWRAFRTRNPVGLSFFGFCVLSVGVSAYILLSVHMHTPIFTAVNALALAFDISLLILMWLRSPTLSFEERTIGVVVLIVGIWTLFVFNALHALSPDFAVALFGWVALVGTVAFYPIQNLRLFIKKDPTGLSFLAFAFLLAGVAALTLFGFLIGSMPIFLGNLFSAVGDVCILAGIARWKK